MYRGKDSGLKGSSTKDLLQIFNEIGGALAPLDGVSIEFSLNSPSISISGTPIDHYTSDNLII